MNVSGHRVVVEIAWPAWDIARQRYGTEDLSEPDQCPMPLYRLATALERAGVVFTKRWDRDTVVLICPRPDPALGPAGDVGFIAFAIEAGSLDIVDEWMETR